jgi:hypothetical protein
VLPRLIALITVPILALQPDKKRVNIGYLYVCLLCEIEVILEDPAVKDRLNPGRS